MALSVATAAGAAGAAERAHLTADPTSPTTVDVSFSVKASAPSAGDQTITGTAQVDLATDQAAVTVSLPAGLPGTSGATTAQAVVAGGTVYVSVPELSALLGSAWVSLAAPASDAGTISSAFTQAASALGDTPGIVSTLVADGATATPLGTKTVGGQVETGTRVDISVAKLLSGSGLPSSAVAKATSTVGSTIPVTLWAYADGRLAQVAVAVSGTTASASDSVSFTADFTGYDTPVTITVPPASATHPLSSGLLKELAPMVAGQFGVSTSTSHVLSHLEGALLGRHTPRHGHRRHATAA
jgi:hypothetical protein